MRKDEGEREKSRKVLVQREGVTPQVDIEMNREIMVIVSFFFK